MNENNKILDISWGGIFKISLAILAFYILYLIRDILIWFIFALIISLLFDPVIRFLKKLKIPRPLAVIFVYVSIFSILGSSIYLITPIFFSEIQQFTQLFPQYFEKIAPSLREFGIKAFENLEVFIETIRETLIKASGSIFSSLATLFGGIISSIAIFSLALFISLEEKGIERAIILFAPKKYEAIVLNLFERSQQKVAGWFGSRILCSFFVGFISFLTLKIFNIDYAFSLSFFAGVTNVVPILGPIIAGIIITTIAAFDSWLKAIFVLVAFIIIQQIEGNILSPILTKKFIGLPPSLVLISLMIGGKIWGILGAILCLPLFGIVFEFLRDFLKKKRESQAELI